MRIVAAALWLPLLLCAKGVGFEQLLDSAHRHSKTLVLKDIDTRIEKQRLEEVKSGYYPTFALSANSEYYKDLSQTGETESVGDTVISSGTKYKSSVALNMNYDLYRFGVFERKVATALKEIRVKTLLYCQQKQKLDLEILDHFTRALKLQRRLKTNREIISLGQRNMRDLMRLYTAGEYSKIALGEAALTLVKRQQNMAGMQKEYEQLLLRLSELTHVPLDNQSRLLPIQTSQNTHPAKPLFEKSVKGREIQKKIEQKRLELEISKRSRLPALALYGNYYFYGADPGSLESAYEDISSNSWKVGLGIRFNLFEGFKSEHERRRLRLELLRLQEQKKLLKRQHRYRFETRRQNLAQLQKQYTISKKTSEKSRELEVMLQRMKQNGEADKPRVVAKRIENL